MSNQALPAVLDGPPQSLLPSIEFGTGRPAPAPHGCAVALAVSELLQQQQKPLLIVCTDTLQAEKLLAEIRFFWPEHPLQHFPEREVLPYEQLATHPDLTAARLRLLYQLPKQQQPLLLLTVSSLMQRLPPPHWLDHHALLLQEGQKQDLSELCKRLAKSHYERVEQVQNSGQFALRGSLLDVFLPTGKRPYRIDFIADQIDSIRRFDPSTQRSIGRCTKIDIIPNQEVLLNSESQQEFYRLFASFFPDMRGTPALYHDIEQGILPPGVESYLPLFYPQTATFFDYLPAHCERLLLPDLHQAAQKFWQQLQGRYENRQQEMAYPPLPPTTIALPVNTLWQQLQQGDICRWQQRLGKGRGRPLPVIAMAKDRHPLQPWRAFIEDFKGRVLIAAASAGRHEMLYELATEAGMKAVRYDCWQDFLRTDDKLGIVTAILQKGVILPQNGLAILTENELFHASPTAVTEHPTIDSQTIRNELMALQDGDPVVHRDNGVGRYRGLVQLQVQDHPEEFLLLEYQGNDRLYVPITALDLISPYSGGSKELAPWHRLGHAKWQKEKRKAEEKAHDVAVELLETAAQRQLRKGISFRLGGVLQHRFAASFPFVETVDQRAAIAAVLADMEKPLPMDRVICGDVGFGKTEVAMRAASVAADNGWQTAILVPTTILARQHEQSFRDRFAGFPLRIASLSRLQDAATTRSNLSALQEGKIDIVIGTHALLQESIRFKKLGLLIIDEEHRFGVRHKEQLKKLRSDIDCLALTATPIPRTLSMSLAGLRELSIMGQPPKHRCAIRTICCQWQDQLLREACQRELARGGQVYVIHPRVRSLQMLADTLAELLPEATIRIAHGQMPERQLEQTMLDFCHRRFQILICTTIIESGIDIPTANTVLINQADRFGLGQLHQLRGRVGRSHHQAYAYLITPPKKQLDARARARLEAITRFDSLGSGLLLAMQDLEIRGAGELLGAEQSGQIQAIGLDLYQQMLSQSIASLRSDKPLPPTQSFHIDLQVPALLPADYIVDVHRRLVFYKRIAGTTEESDLHRVQWELADRFGPLPAAAKQLFAYHKLRLLALPLGIHRVAANAQGGQFHFRSDSPIEPMALLQCIRQEKRLKKLSPAGVLDFSAALDNAEKRLQTASELLHILQQTAVA